MSDLQQRIAEQIDGVIAVDCGHDEIDQDPNVPGRCRDCHETAKRIAERLMPVVREAQHKAFADGGRAAINENSDIMFGRAYSPLNPYPKDTK